ncbi:MAG: peptide-methionine (S)-S-oxide reductase MsrA, partial [Proteobacteria bacterium]|nr:peptide-methionine (S)-S-oxide reductase MsrA [Pseudomonadota bacterium]
MLKQQIIKFCTLCLLLFSVTACAEPEQNKTKPLVQPESATSHLSTLVLGSGCFWGAEKFYESLDGVVDAVSGYADGQGIEPTYQAITQAKNRFNDNNYAEVVKVTYNTDMISTEDLIKHFFELHDPTQRNRQGNDVGTQYRSILLTTTESQLAIAKSLRDAYQEQLTAAGYGEIQTEIKALDQFNPAEEYHQD